MTIGEIIKELKKFPQDLEIQGGIDYFEYNSKNKHCQYLIINFKKGDKEPVSVSFTYSFERGYAGMEDAHFDTKLVVDIVGVNNL